MRPDLLDHLAPLSRPVPAGLASLVVFAAIVAGAVLRLAQLAPIEP